MDGVGVAAGVDGSVGVAADGDGVLAGAAFDGLPGQQERAEDVIGAGGLGPRAPDRQGVGGGGGQDGQPE